MKAAVARLLPLLLALASPAVLADGDRLTLYPAYSDGATLVIEGRIVERHDSTRPDGSDGRLTNLRRSARQFFNDERQQQLIQLRLPGYSGQARSDGEGYFRLAEKAALAPGWQQIQAEGGKTSAIGQLLVVPRENQLGLISDLDDTILVSEVTDKRRLLANTFLKNAAQRQVVPGMAALYTRVMAHNAQPAAAPLFYLSASPRQMHEAITDFLGRHAFPPGVLITKRITNDFSSEPRLDQFSYKIEKIEEIFARLPWVRFVLVGDDGERDPETYDWVRQHYPERVADIWIRRVSPDPLRHRPPQQKNLADVLGAESNAIPAALLAPAVSLSPQQGTTP
jgi:phosphatidate phosphatase APP1